MQEFTLEELKERIVDRMNPDELLEILDLPMQDLVEALTDHISENYDKLVRELSDED